MPAHMGLASTLKSVWKIPVIILSSADGPAPLWPKEKTWHSSVTASAHSHTDH